MTQELLLWGGTTAEGRLIIFYALNQEDAERSLALWRYQHPHLPEPTLERLPYGLNLARTSIPSCVPMPEGWLPCPELSEVLAHLEQLNAVQNAEAQHELLEWFASRHIDLVQSGKTWLIPMNMK
jgi:hypothetical protein